MELFSEISNNQTVRDNIISNVVSASGLAKEKVTELYESFSLMHGGDIKMINESFVDFLNPNTSGFDFAKFQEDIFDFANSISNNNITPEDREIITNNFIKYIEKTCDIIVDVPRILEIICYILLLKNKKFENISNKIGFGNTTQKLFESDNINILKINVDATNSTEINKINAKEDIRFYGGLKNLLAKNNNRWGYNYHLSNAYKAITDYLEAEIEELVNFDNIVSVDHEFTKQFLLELLTTKQLNPQYRNINYLRTVISDIQTLVFDLMIIVSTHIKNDQWVLGFLNRENFLDYLSAEKLMVSRIISSNKKSTLTNYNKDNSCNGEQLVCSDDFVEEIGDVLVINNNFVNIWRNPINTKVALDALHVIKACESEFALPIRKVLNNYVTKSTNLIVNLEKIILRQRTVNKYKSY